MTRPVVLLALLSVLAAACGRLTGGGPGPGNGGTPSPGIEHPTRPDQLILRVQMGGGFLPLQHRLAELPSFSLMGDGTLVTLGPQIEIYPGPALPNLLARSITEDGVQAILRAAGEAGLLAGDRDLGMPAIADAGTTTVTVAAKGAVHTTRAYALEDAPQDDPQLSEEQRAARERLIAFRDRLGDLEGFLPEGSVGEERRFRFDELRVFVLESLEPMSPEDELEHPEIVWPLGTPLRTFGEALEQASGVRCGSVRGADLETLLEDARRANQLTPWTSGGATYYLVFRPLLPDESECEGALGPES